MQAVITDKIRGKTFTFNTQEGIFSKNGIDEGTRLLLENIEIKEGSRILDLGCGYGAIGIVSGSIFKSQPTLVDSDIRAVRLTKRNLKENGVIGEAIISDGYSDIDDKVFDAILTYPPSHEGKEVVEGFVKGAKKHLLEKGQIYLVTESRLKSYFNRLLKEFFGNTQEVAKSKRHVLLKAIK